MSAFMFRLVLILIVVLFSAGSSVAKDWRGILPLHSTRADVERLLGVPIPVHGREVYAFKEWQIFIEFAEKNSSDLAECLAIAEGTVLAIRVEPSAELSLKDLGFEESRFRQFNPAKYETTEFRGFVDEAEGLVIRTRKGIVQEIVYLASAVDRPRCPGFYSDLEAFVRVPVGFGLRFDEWGDIRFADEKARLDNFAIQILHTPEARGHVIVYAGQKAVVAEAQLRGKRIKDYLLNVCNLRLDQVTVVDGGHRESLTVQLHILPPGVTPPEPNPTVQAKDVEIIYEQPKRRSRKNP